MCLVPLFLNGEGDNTQLWSLDLKLLDVKPNFWNNRKIFIPYLVNVWTWTYSKSHSEQHSWRAILRFQLWNSFYIIEAQSNLSSTSFSMTLSLCEFCETLQFIAIRIWPLPALPYLFSFFPKFLPYSLPSSFFLFSLLPYLCPISFFSSLSFPDIFFQQQLKYFTVRYKL